MSNYDTKEKGFIKGCNICPRNCGADRKKILGFCNACDTFKIAFADLHCWEEPPISGAFGSGAIFFSGCNLKCCYCQNHDISHGVKGVEISERELIDQIKKLEDRGAESISFVTPTHYTPQIAKLLCRYKPSVPVVFNSSGYDSVESLGMLEGLVDVYLPDFKYADNTLGEKYSKVSNYKEVAILAISEMKRQQPSDLFATSSKSYVKNNKTADEKNESEDSFFDANDYSQCDKLIMQKGVIIRHLLLPSNINNSLSVLDIIKENFGKETYISLMRQYTPITSLNLPEELKRNVKPLEYKILLKKAQSLGFCNGFVQEDGAASEEFIPQFVGGN